MSSSDNTGCIGTLLIGGTIVISIGSGILAWNWVEPKSFGRAILFLFAWSLLSYVGYLIMGGIVAALGGMN